MKLVFEGRRNHGHGLEKDIAEAISNIRDVIRDAEEFVYKYPLGSIYVDIPLEISEDDGEYYLVVSNVDNEKWIEWRTIYTDKKAYESDAIYETVATLVMD